LPFQSSDATISLPHYRLTLSPTGLIVCYRGSKQSAVVFVYSLNLIGGTILLISMIFLPLVLSPFIVLCFMILFAGKPAN